MNPDLGGIFLFVFLMSILAAVTAMLIHRRVVRHEEAKLELQARIEEARAQQALGGREETSRFEERLRVLERIATDGNTALAAQIEELRALDAIDNRAKAL